MFLKLIAHGGDTSTLHRKTLQSVWCYFWKIGYSGTYTPRDLAGPGPPVLLPSRRPLFFENETIELKSLKTRAPAPSY